MVVLSQQIMIYGWIKQQKLWFNPTNGDLMVNQATKIVV